MGRPHCSCLRSSSSACSLSNLTPFSAVRRMLTASAGHPGISELRRWHPCTTTRAWGKGEGELLGRWGEWGKVKLCRWAMAQLQPQGGPPGRRAATHHYCSWCACHQCTSAAARLWHWCCLRGAPATHLCIRRRLLLLCVHHAGDVTGHIVGLQDRVGGIPCRSDAAGHVVIVVPASRQGAKLCI